MFECRGRGKWTPAKGVLKPLSSGISLEDMAFLLTVVKSSAFSVWGMVPPEDIMEFNGIFSDKQIEEGFSIDSLRSLDFRNTEWIELSALVSLVSALSVNLNNISEIAIKLPEIRTDVDDQRFNALVFILESRFINCLHYIINKKNLKTIINVELRIQIDSEDRYKSILYQINKIINNQETLDINIEKSNYSTILILRLLSTKNIAKKMLNIDFFYSIYGDRERNRDIFIVPFKYINKKNLNDYLENKNIRKHKGSHLKYQVLTVTS